MTIHRYESGDLDPFGDAARGDYETEWQPVSRDLIEEAEDREDLRRDVMRRLDKERPR